MRLQAHKGGPRWQAPFCRNRRSGPDRVHVVPATLPLTLALSRGGDALSLNHVRSRSLHIGCIWPTPRGISCWHSWLPRDARLTASTPAATESSSELSVDTAGAANEGFSIANTFQFAGRQKSRRAATSPQADPNPRLFSANGLYARGTNIYGYLVLIYFGHECSFSQNASP